MEHLIELGIFAGKFLIVFLFFVSLIILLLLLIAKQKLKPELQMEDYGQKLKQLRMLLQSVVLNKKDLKKEIKAAKLKEKSEADEVDRKKHIYVVDFKGDIKASSVDELRDEITAILLIAKSEDEVLICIESPGGVVHGYGLAAAQIVRLKKAGLRVTVAVDKVAASGGYMMACTAHKIIAAPFAIIGSIGVIAQVPNFHRLLKKNEIDYEEVTSGEFKRTVSMLGEITDKGRSKFLEQITDTHTLFKEFVAQERPIINISDVATGEYWFGTRALQNKLVDELMTSDEYLLQNIESAQIYRIKYEGKKNLSDKLNDLVGSITERIYTKLQEWEVRSRQL